MDSKQLQIAYSGSLDAFDPNHTAGFAKCLKQWFWTFKNDTVDSSTRSAYYLIQAVQLLKSEYGVTSDQLQLKFWGHINPLNNSQVINSGLSDFFDISGYLPKSESIVSLSQADMLFLPLEKSNVQGRGTLFIPGKLFEYLNSYKPILALCEPSDCRDILIQSGLGICINPDRPIEIAQKILEFITDKSLLEKYKPNKRYISDFSFRNKTFELSEIFRRL